MKPKIILILTYIISAKSEIYFSETDIPEMAYLDPKADPCDNFYQFACGNFAAIHPRPSTLDVLSQVTLLQDELVHIGRKILSYPVTDRDPTALKKAKETYNSCLSSSLQNSVPQLRTIIEVGGMPLLSSSNDTIIFSWNDIGELVSQYGVSLIFTYGVVNKNSNESIIELIWDSWDYPNLFRPKLAKNYDQVLEEGFKKIAKRRVTQSNKTVKPFDIFLQTVAKHLLNYTNPDKPEEKVIAELNEVTSFMETLYYSKKPEKGKILPLKSEVSLGQLQEWTNRQFGNETNIDWVSYLNRVFKKSGVVITPQIKISYDSIKYIYDILNLVIQTDPRVIKNFALLQVFLFQAPDSDYTTRKAFEDYYKAENYEHYERWEYCTRNILDVASPTAGLNLVKQTDPRVIKNFALLRVFLFQAPDSDYTTRKAFEDFYKAENYEHYDRWEYCTRKILDIAEETAGLSFAVTYAYQRYYFNKEKLSQASDLFKNVQTAFEENLKTVDWMDNDTRDAPLVKVKNMLGLLGYPDFVENKTSLDKFYENLQISKFDNYENAREIRAFKQAYQFTQLRKPSRIFWGISTLDLNAYNIETNNNILIPISILNLPFFGGNNPILDYSRLGSIIGHEITHGFDFKGKNYDLDGTLNPVWPQKILHAFNERTMCFKKQYAQYYIPEIKRHVNGSYTMNENLADNEGLRASFKAFKTVVKTKQMKSSGNYTLEQLYFIGYGTMWCSNSSKNYLTDILVSDHSPQRYRVVGSLSNMEEFSKAFSCPIGSKMNPEKKCRLW